MGPRAPAPAATDRTQPSAASQPLEMRNTGRFPSAWRCDAAKSLGREERSAPMVLLSGRNQIRRLPHARQATGAGHAADPHRPGVVESLPTDDRGAWLPESEAGVSRRRANLNADGLPIFSRLHVRD
jgi:hypothetical protein